MMTALGLKAVMITAFGETHAAVGFPLKILPKAFKWGI